jgi:hypothetical protein
MIRNRKDSLNSAVELRVVMFLQDLRPLPNSKPPLSIFECSHSNSLRFGRAQIFMLGGIENASLMSINF